MPYELFDLEVQEVSGVDRPATGRTFLIIKRAQTAKADHPEPDGDEQRPQDYASRSRQADLWSCLYDKWDLFRTTLYDILGDCDEDNIPHLPILVDSIGQFQADVQQLLTDCGIVQKAAPLLEELSKLGAVMSADRKQRLQAAIDALQCLLDEACTVKRGARQGPEPMADKSEKEEKVLVVAGNVAQEQIDALTKRAETAEASAKAAEATVKTLSTKIDQLTEELRLAKQTPEEQEAAYLATLPESVRKRLAAQEEANVELRKEMERITAHDEQVTYVAKTADFASVGLTPNHWRCLKALDVLATQGYEEERTEILRLLTAAGEQLTTGGLFSVAGTGAGAGTTAAAGAAPTATTQILALVKSYASEHQLSQYDQAAMDAVAHEHPELWKQYQADIRLRNRGQIR